MIIPAKIALEMALLVTAFALFRFAADTGRLRFIMAFTALTLVLNLVFYYIAAWPLYASYGESSGVGRSELHALVVFDVIKWGVLAYVLSRLAAGLAAAGFGGGFALLRNNERLGGAVALAGPSHICRL